MTTTVFVLCVVFNSIILVSESARILAVFPTPSVSHQVVFRPLTQELAKRGHDVVVITTDPAFPKGETPVNLTEIDVHDISYKIWREEFMKTATGNKDDLYTQVKVALNLFTVIFEKQIQTVEVQRIIQDKNKSFDLLMVEACVKPAIAFSYLYNAPVIQVSSLGAIFGSYDIIGAPTHPILYPSITRQRLYNLTFLEKVTELYNYYSIEYLFHNQDDKDDTMLRRNFGTDIPTIEELSNNVHMLFLNIHPIWEGNQPVPPSVIHMGGIHQKPEKEIPQDLKTYLDSSVSGVIYMSFGTNTNPSMLPSEKIQIFVKVFSELDYDILWKWDKDELPEKPKNIRISKWFPQSDLLRHPKIKLFITQGGLQSTDEAITAGVPLVGIPMLGDQWYNVEKYVYHKIGLRLDLETLTEDRFRDAIKEVIGNERYRRNIKKLKELMHDQPQPGLQRAVWWTEHVIRHKGAMHLRAPAANMRWAQYLDIEFVATLAICLLVFVIVSVAVIHLLLKMVLGLSPINSFKLKVK